MARGAGTVTVSIIGKADKLKGALSQSEKDLDGFGNKLNNFGKSAMVTGAKFTAGLTLPIVGGLGLATKAAAEDEQAQAKLAHTLINTVGASKKVADAVEGQIGKWMKLSTFSDDELRPGFENLVRATGDVEQANKLMGLAMDIAAAKGLPLEQVTMALAKAQNGNVGALGRLGIATKDAAGETKTFEQVMHDASLTFGGSAQKELDTTAGRTKAMTRDLGELTEQLGSALVPILDKVIPLISKVAEWFSNLSPRMQTTILIVAGLAAAIGPLVTVVGALSAAMAFLAANPIVLVIAAIAALAAGLVIAYQKCEGFRNVVNTVFEFLKTLVVNHPLFLIGKWAVQSFDEIVGAARWAWDQLKGIFDAIRKGADKALGPLDEIIGGTAGLVGKGIGALTGGVSKLKFWADGGIVTRPTLGVAGEAGPEAIIPLNKLGALGGGPTYQIVINGPVDAAGTAREIQDLLRRYGATGAA